MPIIAASPTKSPEAVNHGIVAASINRRLYQRYRVESGYPIKPPLMAEVPVV
jgi:hypothetical protein